MFCFLFRKEFGRVKNLYCSAAVANVLGNFLLLIHLLGGGQMLYITTNTFMLGLCLFVTISLNHDNWVLCVSP